MKIHTQYVSGEGIKLSFEVDGNIIARAYLYLLHNDLHTAPFGFLEDLFVDENYRGKGYGKQMLQLVIDEAKNTGCYKLMCTSRYKKELVHSMYTKAGFKDHGKEFRLDLV